MLCIPHHWVSYKHQFYKAGEAFEIDEKDADEMQLHGELIDEPKQEEPKQEEPAKRAGRNKKNA